MSREYVRSLKRNLRSSARFSGCEASRHLTQESALSLLKRSIDMKHKRLALVRLDAAIRFDATVPAECWRYCSQVAGESTNGDLRALFSRITLEAARKRSPWQASGVTDRTAIT